MLTSSRGGRQCALPVQEELLQHLVGGETQERKGTPNPLGLLGGSSKNFLERGCTERQCKIS